MDDEGNSIYKNNHCIIRGLHFLKDIRFTFGFLVDHYKKHEL